MEFLKIARRRSFLSHVLYVIMNVALAIALVLVVRLTGSLALAFLIVLLSKWRVLAVRPRYWFANVQANLVDIVVSVSFVIFLYVIHSGSSGEVQKLVVQIILLLLYIAWLLFLKQKSKRTYVVAQAAVALFTGVTTLYMLSYDLIASVPVVIMWLIGYATARHVLSSYDESNVTLISLAWGLVMAEIGWLAHHWTVAYSMPGAAGLMIPQVSIITISLGFLFYKAYDSYFHNQKIKMNDIIMPLLFTVGVTFLLVTIFNDIQTGLF